ncbi:MAG: ethanolamine utilization protein EutH [Oscillospiraceae bacterium]|nr:ethanolamine utilization protein EutH [Oscillospiraceae bacterium]
MGISKVIMIIMATFFVLGALDRLFGNKVGMGAEFERAFGLMGPTSLTVVGLICFAPVLAPAILKVVGPVFNLIGADPAMLPGVLLSCDVGYHIGAAMSSNYELSLYGGLLVGSVMGFVISFTIPVACGLIKKEDYRYFSGGVLMGYIFDPVACFIGGVCMGLDPVLVLINLIPVIIIALIVILGLLFAPEGTMKVFKVFAKLLLAVITVGLCSAAIEAMTGFVVIKGMTPIVEGWKTIGTIVLSLGGSLPLMHALRLAFSKPINRLGAKAGINDVSVFSIILAFTSLVPGYSKFHEMNPKGKLYYAAFSASAGCMLACHLGFPASIDPVVVTPVLIAKAISGVLAMFSVTILHKRIFKPEELAEPVAAEA